MKAAVKSPCYTCGTWGGAGFPDCAEACPSLEAYRAQTGLLVKRKGNAPLDWQALNRGARAPMEFTEEALECMEFMMAETHRRRLTYGDLAAEIGLTRHRVAGIAAGRYKRIRPDIYDKIATYRRAAHE